VNIDHIKQQLLRHEGLRNRPYHDTAVPPRLTIGVGRNLDDVGVFADEIELMLTNDINRAIKDLTSHIEWWNSLDEARRGILVNMTFNMGISGLLKFQKMLAALQSGDYQKAADEMTDSAWYKQVGVRALELVNQMRTGNML
jgi:lysozyme